MPKSTADFGGPSGMYGPSPAEQELEREISSLIADYEGGRISAVVFADQALQLAAKRCDIRLGTETKNQDIVASYLDVQNPRYEGFAHSLGERRSGGKGSSSRTGARACNLLSEGFGRDFSEPSFVSDLVMEEGTDWSQLLKEVLALGTTSRDRSIAKRKAYLILDIVGERSSDLLVQRVRTLLEHPPILEREWEEHFWNSALVGSPGDEEVLFLRDYTINVQAELANAGELLFGKTAVHKREVMRYFLRHALPPDDAAARKVRADVLSAFIMGLSRRAETALARGMEQSSYIKQLTTEVQSRVFKDVALGREDPSVGRVLKGESRLLRAPEVARQEFEELHSHVFLDLSSLEHPEKLTLHYLTFSADGVDLETFILDRYFRNDFEHSLTLSRQRMERRLLASVYLGKRVEKAFAEGGNDAPLIKRGLEFEVVTSSGNIPLRSTLLDLGYIDNFSFENIAIALREFMRQDHARILFGDAYEKAEAHVAAWSSQDQSDAPAESMIHERRSELGKLLPYCRHILFLPQGTFPVNQQRRYSIFYIEGIVSLNISARYRHRPVHDSLEDVSNPGLLYHNDVVIYDTSSHRVSYGPKYMVCSMRARGLLAMIENGKVVDLGEESYDEEMILQKVQPLVIRSNMPISSIE